MEKKPTISVLMSVYNEEESWLRESIESILNQTFTDFEYIIILDNPTNHLLREVIKEYQEKDQRIIFLENEKNLGPGGSKNRGLEVAQGEYIAIMDADDISLPQRFAKQIEFMKNNPKIDLLGSWAEIINENGEIKGLMRNETEAQIIKKITKYSSTVYHSSWIAKREIYEKLNGYREIYQGEDYDFLLRTLEKGYLISNLDKVLIKYRVRFNQTTQKKSLEMQKAVYYLKKAHREKLRNGKDVFNKEEFLNFQKSSAWSRYFFQKSNKYFIKAKLQLFQKKSLVLPFFYLSLSFILSPIWGGRRILANLQAKIIARKYKNKIKY